MKRWQWYTVAVFAGMVALEALVFAAPSPNNCGLNMLCRVRTLFVSGDATFSGDAGFSGSMVLGGTLAVPTVITNVMDAGTGVVTGPLTVGGASSLQDVTGGVSKFNISDAGTMVATGPLNAQTAIVNIATTSTCSSNTGAVCIDDANGLAIANGSGTTVATISNAGKASIATLAITATTDLGTCTIDGAGTCTGTVRANSKCIACWDITAGTSMTCVLSGTTLSLSGGTPTNTAAWFCPTQS